MFTATALVLFAGTTGLIALTPTPEPELLFPEPMTPARLLASLVPGWITRRRASGQRETVEDTNTIAWLTKVKETGNDRDRFTIGADRGKPVTVNLTGGGGSGAGGVILTAARPPWGTSRRRSRSRCR